jgi:putative ABC transport system permease protein
MKFGGWMIMVFSASWWLWNCNIMFVSVLYNLIGIQKSLGAKNKFILFQFYLIHYYHGVIGLCLVWVPCFELVLILNLEWVI